MKACSEEKYVLAHFQPARDRKSRPDTLETMAQAHPAPSATLINRDITSSTDPGAVPEIGAFSLAIKPHQWYFPANFTPLDIDLVVYDDAR